jgi:hypothetical protein
MKYGLCKMTGISGLAKKILAPQGNLCFTDLVVCLIGQLVYWLVCWFV